MKRYTIENPEGYPVGSYEEHWDEVTFDGKTYLRIAVESVADEYKGVCIERACELALHYLEEAPYSFYDNQHWLDQMEEDIKAFGDAVRMNEDYKDRACKEVARAVIRKVFQPETEEALCELYEMEIDNDAQYLGVEWRDAVLKEAHKARYGLPASERYDFIVNTVAQELINRMEEERA